MTTQYSVEGIGFKRKKRRLIAVIVIVLLILMTLVDPAGWAITVSYGVIFVPMVILWIPDYKDAKILQEAYDRAVGTDSE